MQSIGGGIELEMDTLRAGPFMIALFANGQAYRLLGDSDIRLFASDGTNTATWDVTLDREIYRGVDRPALPLLPRRIGAHPTP